jgi:hypothetical protein
VRDAIDDRPLRDVWRLLAYLAWRLRCRAAKTAAVWTAAAAVAALTAVVALGAAAGLPASVVWMTAGAGAVAVAVAAAVGYRPRPSATYLARLVERERPELKESLVTLVELAADASSDRSMQTALARRAARILSRDPPHAFLPTVSWRRPGWTLAASAVMLGCVLWMAKGTAVAPWLPGATAGTPTLASGEGSGAAAQADEDGVRPGARAAREHAGGAGRSSREREVAAVHERARDVRPAGRDEPAGAAGAAAGGGSEAVARAGDARAPRSAGGAREHAGGASQGDGIGASPRPAPREQGGEPDAARAGEQGTDPRGGAGGADGGDRSSREREFADTSGRPRDLRPAGADPSPAGGGPADGHTRPLTRTVRTSPLPQRNPGEAAPENVLDTMRQRKPLMEKDDRSPEGDAPPRPFLGKMGVNPADDRRYTTAWSAGRQRSARDSDAAPGHPRPAAGPAENGRLLTAAGDAAARSVVVPTDAEAGERGRLIHAAEVRVSPRLRPAVRAYFERIGRLGGRE